MVVTPVIGVEPPYIKKITLDFENNGYTSPIGDPELEEAIFYNSTGEGLAAFKVFWTKMEAHYTYDDSVTGPYVRIGQGYSKENVYILLNNPTAGDGYVQVGLARVQGGSGSAAVIDGTMPPTGSFTVKRTAYVPGDWESKEWFEFVDPAIGGGEAHFLAYTPVTFIYTSDPTVCRLTKVILWVSQL